VIQDKEGFEPAGYDLVFAGKRMKGSWTLAQYRVQHESMVFMMPFMIGGGKRASAADDGTRKRGGVPKNKQLADMEETMGTSLMRLQATLRAAPPVVNDVVNRAVAFGARIKTLNNPLTAGIAVHDGDGIQEMLLQVLSTTNINERFRIITETIFEESLTDLNEVERQVKLAKGLMMLMVEYSTIKEYASSSGQMDWQELAKTMVNRIKEAAVDRARARAQADHPMGLQ
jgi:hypothetical protein